MAMGKRKERQEALFVTYDNLPRSADHPFYVRRNQLLAEAGFDHWIERRCQPYHAQEEKRGQPSIPPRVYFRTLLVATSRTSVASETEIEEVVADKGYHTAATLELCDTQGLCTYIPEPQRPSKLSNFTSPGAFS